MRHTVIFDSLTGEVRSAVSGPAGLSPTFDATKLSSISVADLHAFTAGAYVENGILKEKPAQPTNSHVWSWEHKEWLYDSALQNANTTRLLVDSLATIDTAAGNTRLKYITSVPGQSETYQRKEEQARAWQATSFAGDAPSFIAAEATALSISAQALALQIIALADYWGNVKGPQIEAARRKAKVAIESAGTDDAAIIAARDAGITELASL